jgi:hypothetical protein
MKPERWFVRDLAAFDPDLFVVWDGQLKRWAIRQWVVQNHRRMETRADWIEKSILIMRICYRDESFHDVGYKSLDERTMHALRLMRWENLNPNLTQVQIDRDNERIENSFQEDVRLVAKDVAIDAWRHYQTHTVH